ncbi:MAG: hypothetical protein MUQ27_11875 [Acidimicrobiia bacterium]|nr:hypothetical protein [Acidimicrobiia bacterium]
MSDRTTEAVHKTMKAMVATAPDAPDIAAVPEAPVVRRRSPALAAVAAFAFALVVGSFVFLAGGSDSAVAAYPAAALAEAQGVALEFVFGPDPQFDTETLGVEMVPEPGVSEDMLDVESVLETAQKMDPTYQVVGSPWYVGQLGGVHGFVVDFESSNGAEMSCQVLARNVAQQGFGCSLPMESGLAATFKYSEDDPGLEGIVATADPNVSVVSVEFESGERYWQRPTRGLALFVTEDGIGRDGFTVSIHDADGTVIGSETTRP